MPKLTAQDLLMVSDHARRTYISFPTRLRLDGMTRDMTDQERRELADLEASVIVLNGLGALRPEVIKEVMPAPYTHVQEIIEEGLYATSADAKQ